MRFCEFANIALDSAILQLDFAKIVLDSAKKSQNLRPHFPK
ncbi:hypothetical protein ACWIUD_05900 [Helicobacter sp. 23-1044]